MKESNDWKIMANHSDNQHHFEIVLEQDIELSEPDFYHVLLINDDYTSMDFVIEILKLIFHKTSQESHRIMMTVHHNGQGIAGTFPKEIAQEKQQQVVRLAKNNHFPLTCEIEPV